MSARPAGCLLRLMLGRAREALGDGERGLNPFQAVGRGRCRQTPADRAAILKQ
jgi:hypothetical protein